MTWSRWNFFKICTKRPDLFLLDCITLSRSCCRLLAVKTSLTSRVFLANHVYLFTSTNEILPNQNTKKTAHRESRKNASRTTIEIRLMHACSVTDSDPNVRQKLIGQSYDGTTRMNFFKWAVARRATCFDHFSGIKEGASENM